MPRFVVLEHDHPALHWDFMLDTGDALRTWRLGALPGPGVTTTCQSLPDHRRDYLDYEGPVSGGRGSVTRLLSGNYSTVEETETRLRVALSTSGQCLEVTLSPATGPGTAIIRAC